MRIPTVEIERNGRMIRVNASSPEAREFLGASGPDVITPAAPQTAHDAPEAAEPPVTPDEPQQVVPEAAAVVKRGRRWFVTNAQGGDVVAPGIDPKGYGKEDDAWAAILGAGNA